MKKKTYSKKTHLEKKIIMDVGFTDATSQDVLEYIVKKIEKNGKKLFIVTPNPEILMISRKDENYKNVLNSADLALADGTGVMWAGRVLGKPLKERVAGVDFVQMLCSAVSKRPITVGFLGGRTNVAEEAAECLKSKYPELKVGFIGEEWEAGKFNPDLQLDLRLKAKDLRKKAQTHRLKHKSSTLPAGRQIINHGVDILFVAFGSPKQELWIYENLDNLPVRVVMGVGGAFDMIAGRVRRAPVFMRKAGLEWLFRLIIQPWRIKRQFRLVEFTFLVLWESIRVKRLKG